jgi:hypothetical protein
MCLEQGSDEHAKPVVAQSLSNEFASVADEVDDDNEEKDIECFEPLPAAITQNVVELRPVQEVEVVVSQSEPTTQQSAPQTTSGISTSLAAASSPATASIPAPASITSSTAVPLEDAFSETGLLRALDSWSAVTANSPILIAGWNDRLLHKVFFLFIMYLLLY